MCQKFFLSSAWQETFYIACFECPACVLLHATVERGQMGCIDYENTAMGLYFICDPEGQRIEILPEKR